MQISYKSGILTPFVPFTVWSNGGMYGSWLFKKPRMRRSMRKLLQKFADLVCFRGKLGKPLLCRNGLSPKKQELPVLQPGIPHSKPRRYRLWPGDCRFDWIDVWGELLLGFSVAFPSCLSWPASSVTPLRVNPCVWHGFTSEVEPAPPSGAQCSLCGRYGGFVIHTLFKCDSTLTVFLLWAIGSLLTIYRLGSAPFSLCIITFI